MTDRITRLPPRTGGRPRNRETGTVLFISLIMLLLLTIIGVTAMNNVTLEERMAGNLRDSDLSFQAAEAGLRAGEDTLSILTGPPSECADPDATCPAGNIWKTGVLQDLQTRDPAWWAANGRAFGAAGNIDLAHVSADPSFVVEYQKLVSDSLSVGHGNATGSHYYLVTSQGVGGTSTAITILQTSVAKRFN